MTIYDTDEVGNIIVIYDSRWQYPELLGYQKTDPQYEMLREKHRRYMSNEGGSKGTGEAPEGTLKI